MSANMRTIKISQLAPLGFGIVIIITVITNLLSQSSTNNLVKSVGWITHTYKVKEDLAKIEKLLVDAETGQRGFIYTAEENFLEPYQNSIKSLKNILVEIRNEIKDNPEQLTRLANVEELTQQKFNELAETISLKRAKRDKEVLALVRSGKGKTIMDNLRAKLAEMYLVEDRLLAERQKAAAQAQMLSNYFSWGSLLLVAGVGLLISLVISRIIARSLGRAVGVAEKVSQGDLTASIEVTSNDEIGKLLESFRTMTRNLNSLVQQIQHSGIQVTTSTTQIAASGKQLEATVTEQVASTNQVVATAKEIAATSGQLVHTMEEVASMSETTTIAAASGQENLVRMEASMRQLAQATNSISTKLGAISEKANNINSIITTITAVADQTNLLSLNAAIEAEKAGEYGLGFAVVAREIRRLADRTAVATLDIENMVKEMQSAVSTGVMEMDKFSQEVTQGFQDSRDIGAQIGNIIQQIQALTPRFQAVNEGMEAQSQGAGQISEAMIQLSESSSQTAESLEEINRAIAQLNEAANGLRMEISRFKVRN
ncbi:MAG TPA: CHASE3 domain-containing protein [Oculatellaceae cyanobacterium]